MSSLKNIAVKLLKIIALPAAGLAVALAGLVYGVLFAGIPYQDPTPAMQARWEFHDQVSNVLIFSGGLCLLGGIVAAPFIWLRLKRGRGQDYEKD